MSYLLRITEVNEGYVDLNSLDDVKEFIKEPDYDLVTWEHSECNKIELDKDVMTKYEKLEYIHFAIQEAIQSLKGWRGSDDPELNKALEFVEDLREDYMMDKK